MTSKESKLSEAWVKVWKREPVRPLIFRFATTGAPDVAVLREKGDITFYEFKKAKGSFREGQKIVLPLLKKMGFKVVVLRNFPGGELCL